jgi:hypothetical protein
VPNTLRDLDGALFEQEIAHGERSDLAGANAGLRENPVVGFVWLRRRLDDALHLLER